MTNDSELSETGLEFEDEDEAADILRGNTIGEIVEQAVLTGVDLRLTAFIGEEQVVVTVSSITASNDHDTLH